MPWAGCRPPERIYPLVLRHEPSHPFVRSALEPIRVQSPHDGDMAPGTGELVEDGCGAPP
jgi:hypothetical protein